MAHWWFAQQGLIMRRAGRIKAFIRLMDQHATAPAAASASSSFLAKKFEFQLFYS